MKSEFTFSTAWRSDADEWCRTGQKITDPDALEAVKAALSDDKMLVLEHWHYRGSRCPDRVVIDDYDDFVDYLKENAIAGDAVHVFDITQALEDGKQLVQGKCPDEHDEVPKKGAY